MYVESKFPYCILVVVHSSFHEARLVRKVIIIIIIYFSCKCVLRGGSGTTRRHNTQITHHTQTKHCTQNYTNYTGHTTHNEYNANTITTTPSYIHYEESVTNFAKDEGALIYFNISLN
jgi:hypothetical protein